MINLIKFHVCSFQGTYTIAADGRVDEMEERQFVELTEELDDVIAAALALRYAEGGVRAWN